MRFFKILENINYKKKKKYFLKNKKKKKKKKKKMELSEEELLEMAQKWNVFIKCLIEGHGDNISSICIDKTCSLEELFRVFCASCLFSGNLHNKPLNLHKLSSYKTMLVEFAKLLTPKVSSDKKPKKAICKE